MKAKTKTVILSALAIVDCVLGGFVISSSITNKSQTKDVEVKASANYIDQSVSNVGSDIMITLEAEKISKELEEASIKLVAEAQAKAEAEAKAKAEAAKKVAAAKQAEAAKKAANANYKTYVASVSSNVESSALYKQVQAKNPWKGVKLSRGAGVVSGPSGKETYYNLDMSGVVRIMRNQGNKDPYWVRSDGVKMLGNYVMVAASFNIRPRGSIVPTSLGLGIVVDTGSFIYSNPTQLDIAVAW